MSNYTDWKNYEQFSAGNVPDSCCKEAVDNCGTGMANLPPSAAGETIYVRGCYDAVKEDLKGATIGLCVVLFIMAIVQVGGSRVVF